jgi:hypothetical protein
MRARPLVYEVERPLAVPDEEHAGVEPHPRPRLVHLRPAVEATTTERVAEEQSVTCARPCSRPVCMLAAGGWRWTSTNAEDDALLTQAERDRLHAYVVRKCGSNGTSGRCSGPSRRAACVHGDHVQSIGLGLAIVSGPLLLGARGMAFRGITVAFLEQQNNVYYETNWVVRRVKYILPSLNYTLYPIK